MLAIRPRWASLSNSLRHEARRFWASMFVRNVVNQIAHKHALKLLVRANYACEFEVPESIALRLRI